MKTAKPSTSSALTFAPMSKAHFRLMRKMGLKIAGDEVTGESPEEIAAAITAKLTPQEREREIAALAWLMSRPLDDLMPGGSARQAIESDRWEDEVERFEFGLDVPSMRAITAYFKASAGE